jgi:phosphohistidine phosphatase
LRIAIMRHGPAEDYSVSGRDHDRALTPSGRQRVREVAEALAAAGEAPRVLLASPLVRARETAEEVGAALRRALRLPGELPLVVRSELSPGRDQRGLVGELFAAGSDNALLVGHEPDLSELVAELSGRPPAGMLKAMVASFELHADPARRGGYRSEVRFVLDPKTLAFAR